MSVSLLTKFSFLFALMGSIAFAKDCAPDLEIKVPSAEAVFNEIYGQEVVVYRHGQCGRNVKEFLLELRRRGVDISRAKVLFLLHEVRQFAGGPFMPAKLEPKFSRRNDKAWDFHVILRYDDAAHGSLVFDLDGRSHGVPIKDYFAQIFPGNDRLKRIALREISAGDYLEAFEYYYFNADPRKSLDDNYVVGDFRAPKMPAYPVTTADLYLNNF